MKKLFIPQLIPCKLFLFFAIVSACSRTNPENKQRDSLFAEAQNNVESTMDFDLIDGLNDSNKKTIHLAILIGNQIKNPKTLQLVLKIKKDHQEMESGLLKLTEKNLIIIPKLVYDLNTNPDSLKAKNSESYLLRVLENQIKNQITVLAKIEKTAQNTDFKTLAIKSKKIVGANYDALQAFLGLKTSKRSSEFQ